VVLACIANSLSLSVILFVYCLVLYLMLSSVISEVCMVFYSDSVDYDTILINFCMCFVDLLHAFVEYANAAVASAARNVNFRTTF